MNRVAKEVLVNICAAKYWIGMILDMESPSEGWWDSRAMAAGRVKESSLKGKEKKNYVKLSVSEQMKVKAGEAFPCKYDPFVSSVGGTGKRSVYCDDAYMSLHSKKKIRQGEVIFTQFGEFVAMVTMNPSKMSLKPKKNESGRVVENERVEILVGAPVVMPSLVEIMDKQINANKIYKSIDENWGKISLLRSFFGNQRLKRNKDAKQIA